MLKDFLENDNITEATKKALLKTYEEAHESPQFFDASSFHLLSRVCDILVNQDSENRVVNVALFIDQRIANKKGKGWRYSVLPPDEILFTTALKGIDETSHISFGKSFLLLSDEEQILMLKSLQQGKATGSVWKQISSSLFFEVLLTETAEIFYSFPELQHEIHYQGMEDKNGWKMDA